MLFFRVHFAYYLKKIIAISKICGRNGISNSNFSWGFDITELVSFFVNFLLYVQYFFDNYSGFSIKNNLGVVHFADVALLGALRSFEILVGLLK